LPIYYDRNATEAIYNEVASKLKDWIPQATHFTRSDIYGIRVYTSGSILATHVDRDPLISSAIINVDQRVEEPWPLEAYDHEGRAHNITLEPGEMILYESHSVLHGENHVCF
jgi:prolyl 4-hydroxylase